jgi:tetratricopeptide (TPR) repeat protein
VKLVRRGLVVCAALIATASGASAATKDRLGESAMRALVGTPVAEYKAGDKAKAVREFEAYLAARRRTDGPNSQSAADALSAFGVLLYTEGFEKDALPYLRRAVDAARAHYAPLDPELAVVLSDYSAASYGVYSDDAPYDADTAAEEALHIRLRTFGVNNEETRDDLIVLKRWGTVARTHKDSVRVGAVGALYDEAIDLMRRNERKDRRLGDTEAEAAEMYLDNGLLPEATKHFDDAMADYATAGGSDDGRFAADEFACKLTSQGHVKESDDLRGRFHVSRLPFSRCR